MKILIITNIYNPNIIGGAEIVAEEIAQKIKTNHEITILTTSIEKNLKPKTEIINGIKVIRFYPLNFYSNYHFNNKPILLKILWHLIDIWNIHTYFTTRQIIQKEKPDIIHSHNISGLSASIWSAAKSCHIPITHTLHDYSLLCSKTTLLKKNGEICNEKCFSCSFFRIFKKHFSKNINSVIAPSNFMLNKLTSHNFFSNTNNHVVYHGVDPIQNKVTPHDHKEIAFLYIGQLEKHKGIETLLDSFLKLKSQNTTLHIAGSGSYEEKIKSITKTDSRVQFHGFVQDEAKNDLFRKSDVLIIPSIWHDNSPKVIYEAYRHGLPAIGSRMGGIPELIDEDKTGYLFEPGNSHQLTKLLKKFISNPMTQADLRNHCLNKAKFFSLDKQAQKYIEIFKECIKKTP